MCFLLPSQRRTKQKVVTDFSTVSKGTSAAAKQRAALRQVLFSQSEKNPATEVLLCPLSLKSVSDNHTNTPELTFTRLHPAGSRPAGPAEAGSGNLRSAGRPEVDLERGKSGNHPRKELDRHRGYSFSTSCTNCESLLSSIDCSHLQ